ncbi:hypothetical protein GGR50DRAFT_691310 [Xylaria sp. CBS 124048]|nr:hypothetical protein GGR50DRAFT_691310 [Xylaria sp. CBS 124048]
MASPESPTSWPAKLEEELNVDVDWTGREYVKNMPLQTECTHDQASNQLPENIEVHRQSNADLLEQTAQQLKDQDWSRAKNIDHIYPPTDAFCSRHWTLPSKAYDIDMQATLDHAHL